MYTTIKPILKFAKHQVFGKFHLLLAVSGLFLACQRSEFSFDEETANQPIALEKASHFPNAVQDMADNPLTRDGVALGKRLFYEGKLSSDNTVSCGFCHIQSNAFTHHGHPVSHGVADRSGNRNTPPIQNMIYMQHFGWDGAITSLQQQPIVPITSHEEMNENLPNIVAKLKNTSDYPKLFKKAFGSPEINADGILKALQQFVATMISDQSKYDLVQQNKAVFSPEEAQGKAIFEQKCASCHSGALFTKQTFANNGLAVNPAFDDGGRFRVTALPSDRNKYRVPSLRNLAYTAPYMHDGRLYSLMAVLDHYANLDKNKPDLDPFLKNMSLNQQEKEQILRFLNTLNDENFIKNKLWLN
jgi:cytochrome c peroxidase